MRRHPWDQDNRCFAAPRLRGAMRRFVRGFAVSVLGLVLLSVGSLSVTMIEPAYAGYDDDRREREEARQERERERAQRQEARRQRQAEREAERAERERQREEARRQQELERQAEEQERQARTKASVEARQNNKTPVTVVPAQTNTGSNERGTDGNDSAQRSDSGGTKRATSNSKQSSSKRTEPARQTDQKTRETTKEAKKNDSDADEDVIGDVDVAVPEIEEPPRTLVEWLNRMGDTPKQPRTSTVTGDGTSKSAVRAQPTPSTKSTTPKTVKAETVRGSTRPASKTPDASAKKTTQAAGQGGTRRSGFDAELLRLGEVRKRQVLASGLDTASLSRARAMGFKVVSSANSPGSSTPVVALTVPEGMSEGAAQDWLQTAMPQARFGPNHVYHIYPAAEVARASPAAKGTASCQGPDCLAKTLLDWKASLSSCASGVNIGVIDTSFDMSHPALKGRSHDLKDFRSSPMAAKSDWHGTAVLSVLAGDAQSATPGIVPAAHFLLAATFGAGPDGQASADAVSVLAALSWLDGKADIINMSFSGPRNDEIELAIRAMAVKGVVFVAAAGNRGPNGPASYPAAYSDVIAVTAVAHDRRGYRHATHGDYVDMAAPGVDVATALPLGKTGLRTGTSFAAPFVTGLLAAMPAVRKGAMTKSDLMARISTDDLGEPGRDPVFGEGLPQAPARCDEIGGIASLPWSPEAQRMSLGGIRTNVSQRSDRDEEPASSSAMGWALGFAP